MSWSSIAQALVLDGGREVIKWLTGNRSEKPNSSEPGDATAERQGVEAGAAAHREGRIAERKARASLEERLNAKLAKK